MRQATTGVPAPPEAATSAAVPTAPPPMPSPAQPAQRAHPGMVALAIAGGLLVAALPHMHHRSGVPAAAAKPQPDKSQPSVVPVVSPVVVQSIGASVPKKAAALKSPSEKSASTTPLKVATPAADLPRREASITPTSLSVPLEPVKLPALAATTATPGTAGPAPVTITGCLEVSVDDDQFRLTDTEGADVPKSRSWRSGFLKKRSAPVALVEPPDPLVLHKHVGQRVSATGVLKDRELKLNTLKVVGPSCS